MPRGKTQRAAGASKGWVKISLTLRRLVEDRADGRCEYCLVHRDDVGTAHEVDHVRSVKHSGKATKDNLAYSCLECNRFKGSDLGSVDIDGEFFSFYNPRRDDWNDHFRIVGARIEALTPTGEVTVRILQLNSSRRVRDRSRLQDLGAYPK